MNISVENGESKRILFNGGYGVGSTAICFSGAMSITIRKYITFDQ